MAKFIKAVIFWGVVVCLGCLAFGFIKACHEDTKDYPGKAQFEAANQQIFVYKDTSAFGGTIEEKTMAEAFSSQLDAVCRATFSGGSKVNAATGGHFLTYCRSTPNSLVFLCHVPDMRGYRGDAREALTKLAWSIAKTKVRGKQDIDLVVGLRGFGSYGPVLEGKANATEPTNKGDGPDEVRRLYSYFAESAPNALD